VGGRYSALTVFGLVPAALMGLDVQKLLTNSREMASVCKPGQAAATNPGAVLGAAMGEAWKQGRDKLTIISDPAWNSFGSWLEQLIAESSGKSGRGLVPVDMEPEVQPEMYGQDRLFVYLRRDGSRDAFINELIQFHHLCCSSTSMTFQTWEVFSTNGRLLWLWPARSCRSTHLTNRMCRTVKPERRRRLMASGRVSHWPKNHQPGPEMA